MDTTNLQPDVTPLCNPVKVIQDQRLFIFGDEVEIVKNDEERLASVEVSRAFQSLCNSRSKITKEFFLAARLREGLRCLRTFRS